MAGGGHDGFLMGREGGNIHIGLAIIAFRERLFALVGSKEVEGMGDAKAAWYLDRPWSSRPDSIRGDCAAVDSSGRPRAGHPHLANGAAAPWSRGAHPPPGAPARAPAG